MLPQLRALRLAATQLTGASLRRVRRRPAHPNWSLMYEATAGVIRQHLETIDLERPERSRRRHEGLGTLVTGTPRVKVEVVEGSAAQPRGQWFRHPDGSALGVLLFLHGGGYCLGSSKTSADLAARLVMASGGDVFALDYRLAPEDPYPAAIEDAVAAYRWLLDEGVAPGQIVVSGDSAGGGLAIALMMALRDAGDPLPAGAALISPWVDIEDDGKGSDDWQGLDTLTPASVQRFAAAYLGNAEATNPRISMVHGDLSGLPPLLVQAGGRELFRDQIQRFVDRARGAGADVRHEVAPDMIDVWHYLASISADARSAIEVIGDFSRERWGSET